MSSDYYSILGVTPAAEDVVIRAAYRALIRHYHPDTNSDPEAQERVRAINAAFAVLRDPARRAEYDAGRTGGDLAIVQEPPGGWEQRRPPAMRNLGLASAALALGLVVAVLALPQPPAPAGHASLAPASSQPQRKKTEPVVELEPESERLARLRDQAGLVPSPPIVMPVPEAVAEARVDVAAAVDPPVAVPAHVAMASPPRHLPRPVHVPVAAPPARAAVPPTPPKLAEEISNCRPGGPVGVSVGCKNERLVALDRMAAGFFSQSMAHADAAKKTLLLSSHTRSAAARSACRSDSCVGDAYVRQMREISAIMEGRELPAQ